MDPQVSSPDGADSKSMSMLEDTLKGRDILNQVKERLVRDKKLSEREACAIDKMLLKTITFIMHAMAMASSHPSYNTNEELAQPTENNVTGNRNDTANSSDANLSNDYFGVKDLRRLYPEVTPLTTNPNANGRGNNKRKSSTAHSTPTKRTCSESNSTIHPHLSEDVLNFDDAQPERNREQEVNEVFNNTFVGNTAGLNDLSENERALAAHAGLTNVILTTLAIDKWSTRPVNEDIRKLLCESDEAKKKMQEFLLEFVKNRRFLTKSNTAEVCGEIAHHVLGPSDDRLPALQNYLRVCSTKPSTDFGAVIKKITEMCQNYEWFYNKVDN